MLAMRVSFSVDPVLIEALALLFKPDEQHSHFSFHTADFKSSSRSLPFNENKSSSRQHDDEAEDTQDRGHVASSGFGLFAELSLVAGRTLAPGHFARCEAVSVTVAALEITGRGVFDGKNRVLVAVGVGRGGRLGRAAFAGFGP